MLEVEDDGEGIAAARRSTASSTRSSRRRRRAGASASASRSSTASSRRTAATIDVRSRPAAGHDVHGRRCRWRPPAPRRRGRARCRRRRMSGSRPRGGRAARRRPCSTAMAAALRARVRAARRSGWRRVAEPRRRVLAGARAVGVDRVPARLLLAHAPAERGRLLGRDRARPVRAGAELRLRPGAARGAGGRRLARPAAPRVPRPRPGRRRARAPRARRRPCTRSGHTFGLVALPRPPLPDVAVDRSSRPRRQDRRALRGLLGARPKGASR